jgi:uncharacterized membrane protein YhfC
MPALTLTASLLIEGGVCLILPIIVLLVWHGKTRARVSPFFVGALMFVLFALVLEQLFHYFVLGGSSPFANAVNGSLLYKAIYGGLAAGIFEETGRLFGFKVMLGRQTAKQTAITYGIGHGGMECMLLAGVNGLVYGLVSAGIITSSMLGSASGSLTAALAATAPATPLWGIMERVSAMLLHIGLSIFVFKAVNVRGKLWLYFLAIFMHALVDAGIVYLAGYVSSVPVIEAVTLGAALFVLVFALNSYDKLPASACSVSPQTVV